MEFLEVLKKRKTTNGPFLPDPVSKEHQHLLVEVAAMAPSHFNSQPWRFVLIDDRDTIEEIAKISGESMRRLLEEGTFWKRYRPYFRFSEAEMEEKRDGIHFDQLPAVLKPFTRQIFSNTGQAVMNRFGVPKTLAEDNRKLVAGSPLLLAVLLDKTEYRPGELSGFYSIFGMGRRSRTSGSPRRSSGWGSSSSRRLWRSPRIGAGYRGSSRCRTTWS